VSIGLDSSMSRKTEPAAVAQVNAEPRAPDGALLGLGPAQCSRRLAAMDWGFEEAPLERDVHTVHPYPAKFIPELPRRLVQLLSLPGELVLDPFSGGGTTGVEAIRLSRNFLGIDANPVGNIAARAKTRSLSPEALAALRSCEAAVMATGPDTIASKTPTWLPSIPNQEKWYAPEIFQALGILRDLISEIPIPEARDLAFVAFVQAAAKLSFQDSETRYVSRPREIRVIEAPQLLLAELRRVRRIAESLESDSSATARFVDGDARDSASYGQESGSAGLVVTSPPYPNTFDYHLYHRFRLFWLGEDPSELRRMEIGSHLRNQSMEDPIASYLEEMEKVLANCLDALAAGRYAVFIVGHGLFKAKVFETAPALAERAQGLGYEHVATIDRPLPTNRRSITKPGRRLLEEQMLFLRKPPAPRSATAIGPNYSLQPYEEDLRLRELAALGGSPRERPDGEISVVPAAELDRAAFVHFLQPGDGARQPTRQCRLESAFDASSRRKNSSYAGHGIHRYKGKFYPQLAKSLINLSGLEPGRSLVVDPFGGSGTVATEAALAGIDAFSFDCNPVAAEVARAKVATVGPGAETIAGALEQMRRTVEKGPERGNPKLGQFDDERIDELERWFPAPVLAKLDWLLETIRSSTSGDASVVMEVLTSDLIREISQQEPKDLRIRRRKVPLQDAPVYDAFLARAQALEKKLRTFIQDVGMPDEDAHPNVMAVCADSGDPASFEILEGRKIDAVVSSPPYAAALPYIDTDRLSLAAVFGCSSAARRALERTMIGSREIGKREQAVLENELMEAGESDLPESTLSFLSDFSAAVAADSAAGFRRRQGPAVLFRYFVSIGSVLGNLAANAQRGAPCWLVLGNSRSTIGGETWVIPTIDEVAAIAERAGFVLRDRLPITVTREDLLNARHAITRNEILHLEFRNPPPAS
jgi:DNA modification methylase